MSPRPFVLSFVFALFLGSTFPVLSQNPTDQPQISDVTSTEPVLRLTTHDQGVFLFRDSDWNLTLEGVSGHARVTTNEGLHYEADTVVSYFHVASAASENRSTSLKQYMLTVLGIILVLGLAAIVLYAAFLATDR